MIVTGDFENGITFEMDGQVKHVIEFQHVKPGKGAAFVRIKLRNVITGAVVEKTFSPTDKYNDARINRREMQYLYNDGDSIESAYLVIPIISIMKLLDGHLARLYAYSSGELFCFGFGSCIIYDRRVRG